jgi:hypothetical protein
MRQEKKAFRYGMVFSEKAGDFTDAGFWGGARKIDDRRWTMDDGRWQLTAQFSVLNDMLYLQFADCHFSHLAMPAVQQ